MYICFSHEHAVFFSNTSSRNCAHEKSSNEIKKGRKEGRKRLMKGNNGLKTAAEQGILHDLAEARERKKKKEGRIGEKGDRNFSSSRKNAHYVHAPLQLCSQPLAPPAVVPRDDLERVKFRIFVAVFLLFFLPHPFSFSSLHSTSTNAKACP